LGGYHGMDSPRLGERRSLFACCGYTLWHL
jgi:hypothetical protein